MATPPPAKTLPVPPAPAPPPPPPPPPAPPPPKFGVTPGTPATPGSEGYLPPIAQAAKNDALAGVDLRQAEAQGEYDSVLAQDPAVRAQITEQHKRAGMRGREAQVGRGMIGSGITESMLFDVDRDKDLAELQQTAVTEGAKKRYDAVNDWAKKRKPEIELDYLGQREGVTAPTPAGPPQVVNPATGKPIPGATVPPPAAAPPPAKAPAAPKPPAPAPAPPPAKAPAAPKPPAPTPAPAPAPPPKQPQAAKPPPPPPPPPPRPAPPPAKRKR